MAKFFQKMKALDFICFSYIWYFSIIGLLAYAIFTRKHQPKCHLMPSVDKISNFGTIVAHFFEGHFHGLLYNYDWSDKCMSVIERPKMRAIQLYTKNFLFKNFDEYFYTKVCFLDSHRWLNVSVWSYFDLTKSSGIALDTYATVYMPILCEFAIFKIIRIIFCFGFFVVGIFKFMLIVSLGRHPTNVIYDATK